MIFQKAPKRRGGNFSIASYVPFIIIFLMIFVFPWVYLAVGTWFLSPNPDKPEIRKAEFPFRLEYQINEGEPLVIEDTLICRYAGISAGTNQKHRKWSYRYGSGNDEIILFVDEGIAKVYNEDGELFEDGDYKIEINLYPGLPSYYMGDGENFNYPYIFCNVKNEKGDGFRESVSGSAIFDSPLLAKYGIKIISWEIADPIENTFT